MNPSFPRALGGLALGVFIAMPAWADSISYPTDATLLRPIDGMGVATTNSFAPSGTDTPAASVISNSLSGNTVTVTSSDPSYVFGAINNADSTEVGGTGTGNQVFINADLGSDTYVFGGYSNGADVTGNKVTITGAAMQAHGGRVHDGTGNASGNSVLVDGGSVGSVSGGYTNGAGAATGNKVEIRNGASVSGTVIGGGSNTGAATGNSVSIVDSEVDGNIEGGFGCGSLSCTNNTVSIGGSSTLGATSDIQGGTGGGDTFTGNTLKLENYTGTGSVSRVYNFASYEFRISNDSKPLRASTNVNFNGPSSARSTISAIALAPGGSALQQQKIPLICASGSGTFFTGTISNNGGHLSGSGYSFVLSQENDASVSGLCVYATVIPELSAPSITPSDTSASFSVTSNINTGGEWQVIDGTDSCLALFPPDGTGRMSANTPFTASTIDPLDPDTDYKLCFAAADYGVYSSPVLELPFRTLATPAPTPTPPTPQPSPSPTPVFSDGDTLAPGSSSAAPAGNSSFCLGGSNGAPVTVIIDKVPYTITPRAENTCFEVFASETGRALILDSGTADISTPMPNAALLEARNGDLVMNEGNARIRATVDPVCTSTRITVLEGKVDAPEWIMSPMPSTGCPEDALTPKQGSFMVGDGKLACPPSALSIKGTWAKLTVKQSQSVATGQQLFAVAGHPVYGWYQHNGQGWMPLSDPFLPFSTATQSGSTTSMPVERLDVRPILGTELYVGNGKDGDEMMRNGRYCGAFKVAP
ncbi:MAG: hypothetical protein FWD77_08685 [Betaproteobacteria bacterium]|nr:hypothetical protein [Betaproteobacteria bacterium]